MNLIFEYVITIAFEEAKIETMPASDKSFNILFLRNEFWKNFNQT